MPSISQKPTELGGILIASSIALFMSGLALLNGSLSTLGILGIITWVITKWLAKSNLKGLSLTAKLPHRLHATQSIQGHIRLHNSHTFLDAYHVNLQLHLPGGTPREMSALWIPSAGHASMDLRLHIIQRSSNLQIPVDITSTFPLGLWTSQKITTLDHQLIVYPRVICPAEFETQDSLTGSHTSHVHDTRSHQELAQSIRAYQPGDSLRHVHWPASARNIARGQSLLTKEFEPPGFLPQHCRVIFHSHVTSGEILRSDRFEMALALTTGTLHFLRELQIKTSFQADFLQWNTRPCHTHSQYIECLTLLAEAQRATHTQSHELKQIAHSLTPGESLILISEMPAESWIHLHKNFQKAIYIDIRQYQYRQLRG